MIRVPPSSTQRRSSAVSDVYKRRGGGVVPGQDRLEDVGGGRWGEGVGGSSGGG